MDARRQQALQKKAEEDKAREEKRIREEDERWKREREKEDMTEKRILKQPGKKVSCSLLSTVFPSDNKKYSLHKWRMTLPRKRK